MLKTRVFAEHEMYSGIIEWYDERKGYGFISPYNGDNEVYVQGRELKGMSEGQEVTFRINRSREIPFAVDVARTFL